MIHIHLDAVGGVAGDMFVAAMLDALPHLTERVLADAGAVLPAQAGRPELRQGFSGALSARRFGLSTADVPASSPELEHTGTHSHDHAHRHPQASAPGLSQAHGDADHAHEHDAGTYRDMAARIAAADLHPGTAEQAGAILGLIARAEATIHRVPVDEVHFHEIADWDSLMDVVAAGSIAAALAGASWTVSPLPLGGGLVKTRHGLLPVPAPATAAMLEGFDWRDDGLSGERVTPTGAAILRHLARPGRPAAGRLAASGTGAGTRQLPGTANILRALVFEAHEGAAWLQGDAVCVIAFDVDDMTGEEIGTAAERLRGTAGVLDVSIAGRFGKKGRPVTGFRLLVRPDAAEQAAAACFDQTSTIGLRLREERRLVLDRSGAMSGGVPVKRVRRPGGADAKAESDALTAPTLAERRAAKRRAESGDV